MMRKIDGASKERGGMETTSFYPINTAPKDVEILVWCPYYGMVVCVRNEFYGDFSTVFGSRIKHATYWTHLPELKILDEGSDKQ